MMRLAISIGTLAIGGAEKFVVNLLKNLDYQRFSVLLIVLSKPVGSVLESEVEKLPIAIIYLSKAEGFRISTILKVYGALKKFKPDILHGNIGGLLYFLPFLIFRRIKMIYTAHTLAEREFGKTKRKIIKSFIKRNKIIPVAISPEIKKTLTLVYNLEDIALITNGIDAAAFRFPRSYTKFETIGHVGRFDAVKNHQVIIDTFLLLKKEHPRLNLRLIGSGSLYSYYQEKYQAETAIKFVGESNNVSEELKKIDLFFMPSIYEGLPLSVLEALASGCVIVASRVGGLKDLIVEGVNGYLLSDYLDVQGFYMIINRLLKNPQKLKEISLENIKKASRYDMRETVKKYQELYNLEAKHVKR
ncbi:MAG: glycosyltransferase [Bacilli bacterium]|nr:glycosyltransferase [Bacilli bacterium]